MKPPEPMVIAVGDVKPVPFDMVVDAYDQAVKDFTKECFVRPMGRLTALKVDKVHVLAAYGSTGYGEHECPDGSRVVMKSTTFAVLDEWADKKEAEAMERNASHVFGRGAVEGK
jgi:hypothetical protein